jgi:hypothetical protein
MLIKSTVHPSQVSMNLASHPNPVVSLGDALVTAGEPRYIAVLNVESGCMCFFQPATAVGTSIQEPPASGLSPMLAETPTSKKGKCNLHAVVRLVESHEPSHSTAPLEVLPRYGFCIIFPLPSMVVA